MPQVDIRSGGLDALARPGNPISYTLIVTTAGYWSGKTWTATAGGTAMGLAVVGDVMTLTLTGAQTLALGNGKHAVLLVDTTGDDTTIISGRLILTNTSTGSPDQSTSVVVSPTVSVDVTVAAGFGLALPSGTAAVGKVPAITSTSPLATAWTDVGTQIELDAETAARIAADALKADLASPALTGNPTAPTQSAGNSSTRLATTAFVGTAVSNQAATDAGTYQPLDSDLTAIAALSTTSYGRALLALADAAAGRTALGLGTAAVVDTGTGAGNAVLGNDARLTDTRTPTDNTVSTAKVVDNAITLPKLADIATASILGRSTAGTGDPEVLTAAQVRTILSLVIGTNVQAWDADLDTLAANNGTTTTWLRALLDAVYAPLSGSGKIQVDVFTVDGSWTKPSWAQSVRVACFGGGGGGGSGRRGAAGSVRCGGGGGGGGGYTLATLLASDLTSPVNVTVGAGGTAGAAVTADSTDGNAGGTGGSSYFGPTSSTAYVRANGAAGGGGGTATAGTAGGGAAATIAGGTGGAASGTGGAGGSAVSTAGGSSGGGAGGGITSGDAESAGSAGGTTASRGATAATAGAIATTGGTATTGPKGAPGMGGGGGGSSKTTVAGSGGTGTVPGGGGGGGGASLNGNNSGAGGVGGAGLVFVVTEGFLA